MTVAHLASPDRAEQLAAKLTERLDWPRRCGSPSSARCSARTSGRAWSRSAWRLRSTDPRGRPQAGRRTGWRGRRALPSVAPCVPEVPPTPTPSRRRLELLSAELGAVRQRRARRPARPAHPHPERAPEPLVVAAGARRCDAGDPGRRRSRCPAGTRPGGPAWSPGGLLRGSGRAGPGQLAVLAVVVALGPRRHRVVGAPRRRAGWRPRPRRRAGSGPGRTGRLGAAVGHSAARAEVVVDVTGKVRRPGIVVLEARVPGRRRPRGGRGSPPRCRPDRRSTWPGSSSTASRSWSACRHRRGRPPRRPGRPVPTPVPW